MSARKLLAAVSIVVFVVALSMGEAILPAHATDPGAIGKIAFVSNRTGNDDIFTLAVNADGTAVPGSLRQLTNAAGPDQTPNWSPDGTRIAYMNSTASNYDVWVMNADGTGKCRLTYNRATDSSADWTPDGQQLAFVSNRDGDYDLYVMNIPATCPTSEPPSIDLTNALDPPYSEWAPNPSPARADGSFGVVFMHGPQKMKSNYDEYLIDRLTAPSAGNPFGTWGTPYQLTSTRDSDYGADWSPDGGTIAFPRELDTYRLYTMDVASRTETPLVITSTSSSYPYGYHVRGYSPSYSGDGSMLVLERKSRYPNGDLEVFVALLDASRTGVTNLINITNSPSSTDYLPDWQSCPTVPCP